MRDLRYDLHMHTEYSRDCDTGIADIESHCLNRGLTGIAVTDHNTIEGALRLRDRVKTLRIILGEEITTRDGDVIGLFLTEPIKPGLSALDTMHAIHAQSGLVYLPHPFDRARVRKSGGASLSAVIENVDIVEIFNGKAAREEYNVLAEEFARRHHKPGGGGSDAHNLRAIGAVTTEFDVATEPCDSVSFRAAFEHSRIVGKRRSPIAGWFIRGRRPLSLAWRRLVCHER